MCLRSMCRIVEKLAPDYPHYLRCVQYLKTFSLFLSSCLLYLVNCLPSSFPLTLLLLPHIRPFSFISASLLLPPLFSSLILFSLSSLCLCFLFVFPPSPPPLFSPLSSLVFFPPLNHSPFLLPLSSISSGMISRVFFVRCVATTTIHYLGSPWTVLLTR